MILVALSAVLSKAALKKNNSNLSAAIWGIWIFVFALIMLRITGAGRSLAGVGARSWLFLILSGLALGGSWLCLFRSLRTGEVIKIAPVYLSGCLMAMLVRMLLFHTTYSINQKIAMVFLALGTLLIALHAGNSRKGGYVWLAYALLSALLACASTILEEYGAVGANEYIFYVVRSAAALVVAVIAAAAVGGKSLRSMSFLDGIMLCLSGAAAGGSAVCYHYALLLGPNAVVTHMDRLSVLMVLVFGCIFLREKLSVRALAGYLIVVCGVFLMLLQTPIWNLFM
jgi:transporter family protein